MENPASAPSAVSRVFGGIKKAFYSIVIVCLLVLALAHYASVQLVAKKLNEALTKPVDFVKIDDLTITKDWMGVSIQANVSEISSVTNKPYDEDGVSELSLNFNLLSNNLKMLKQLIKKQASFSDYAVQGTGSLKYEDWQSDVLLTIDTKENFHLLANDHEMVIPIDDEGLAVAHLKGGVLEVKRSSEGVSINYASKPFAVYSHYGAASLEKIIYKSAPDKPTKISIQGLKVVNVEKPLKSLLQSQQLANKKVLKADMNLTGISLAEILYVIEVFSELGAETENTFAKNEMEVELQKFIKKLGANNASLRAKVAIADSEDEVAYKLAVNMRSGDDVKSYEDIFNGRVDRIGGWIKSDNLETIDDIVRQVVRERDNIHYRVVR